MLTAPPPVIGIGLTYDVDKKDNESVKVTRSTKRMPTELYTKVKVDVVADNGRSLIRINTCVSLTFSPCLNWADNVLH